MNNLQTHVLGYLETLGFNFLDKAYNHLTADKAGFGGKSVGLCLTLLLSNHQAVEEGAVAL